MPDIDWTSLLLLVGCVGAVALYGLSVSGHFPAEHRSEGLRGGAGRVVLWGTMAAAALAGVLALVRASFVLPWPATVIGAGAALLFAPLLLQPLPDSFVNGRRGLVVFAAGAAMLAAALWWA